MATSFEESEKKLDWIDNIHTKTFLLVTKIKKISPVDPEIALLNLKTSGSAIAEGPRDVLVSRNSATTKYHYRMALFA